MIKCYRSCNIELMGVVIGQDQLSSHLALCLAHSIRLCLLDTYYLHILLYRTRPMVSTRLGCKASRQVPSAHENLLRRSFQSPTASTLLLLRLLVEEWFHRIKIIMADVSIRVYPSKLFSSMQVYTVLVFFFISVFRLEPFSHDLPLPLFRR